MSMLSSNYCFTYCNSVSLAIPCIIALLPGRAANIYKHLFELLKEEAKQLRLNFNPDFMTTDFEPGLIKAVKDEVYFLFYLTF